MAHTSMRSMSCVYKEIASFHFQLSRSQSYLLTAVPYATRTEGHYHASRGGEEELLEGGVQRDVTLRVYIRHPGGEASLTCGDDTRDCRTATTRASRSFDDRSTTWSARESSITSARDDRLHMLLAVALRLAR